MDITPVVKNLVNLEIIFRLPKTTEQLYRDHDSDFIDTFLLDPEDEPKCFFYVSDFLGRKLALEGELVLPVEHWYIWGNRIWGDSLENHPCLLRIAEGIYKTFMHMYARI